MKIFTEYNLSDKLGGIADMDGLENNFEQPFKEKPSADVIDSKGDHRINAHELFSLYTANVIKEDIVFSR